MSNLCMYFKFTNKVYPWLLSKGSADFFADF